MSSTVRLLYVKRLWRKASTCKGAKGHRLNFSSIFVIRGKTDRKWGFRNYIYKFIFFSSNFGVMQILV